MIKIDFLKFVKSSSPNSDPDFCQTSISGDNSREYLLPYEVCSSEHSDFKCVSPQTVAELITGKFDGNVDEYLIIDTR